MRLTNRSPRTAYGRGTPSAALVPKEKNRENSTLELMGEKITKPRRKKKPLPVKT